MNKPLKFIFLAIFLFACNSLPSLLQPTPESASCSNLQISQDDIDYVLNYAPGVFITADWTRSTYTVEQQQVYVAYAHNTLYGVGFVSNIILCNAPLEVKNYASDENISIILSNDDQYETLRSCQKDGLLLYELNATEESRDYDAKIWFTPSEKRDHALEVMLVIPKENPELMAEYAQKLFPELTSCK